MTVPRPWGSPKSRQTFWGEEEQRRERVFRAWHGNERYKVCDDESTVTPLDGAGIENDIRKNATDIGWHYDPHADICLT